MGGNRMIGEDALARLKAATRRLVRAAGGVEAAAAVTRVGKSNLSDYQSPNSGQFAPVDVIADLEAECGEPIVTRLLCALAGGTFIRVASREGDGDLMRWMAHTGKEAADVFQRGYAALADGEIAPAEAEALRAEIFEAIEAFATLRDMLPGGEARPPALRAVREGRG